MDEKWYLERTENSKQVLKIRNDIDIKQSLIQFPNLVLITFSFHNTLTPIEECLAIFTIFENNYLESFEEENELSLLAVDTCNGLMHFYLYCKDVNLSIEYTKKFFESYELDECKFETILEDCGKRLEKWL